MNPKQLKANISLSDFLPPHNPVSEPFTLSQKTETS